MTIDKHFDEWNEVKKSLEKGGHIPVYRERDVWWYAAGENLGSEIDGKGEKFSRPILIVRKYGATTFFGVPLSTKNLKGFWYDVIEVKGINRCVLLSQASSFSVFRLYDRIDKISIAEFDKIRAKLGRVLLKITP